MADEKPNLSYDWNLLGYATVAQDYLEQGDEHGMQLARKSLELILKDANISDPWIINTITDKEVVKKTIENQLSTYSQFKGDQKVGDILDYYEKDFNKYLEEGSDRVKKDLSEFTDKKYSEIMKETMKARHDMEGYQKGLLKEDDAKEAQKIMEKYNKLNQSVGLMEKLKNSVFKSRVEEEATKEVFKNLYPKEENQENSGESE